MYCEGLDIKACLFVSSKLIWLNSTLLKSWVENPEFSGRLPIFFYQWMYKETSTSKGKQERR